MDRTNSASSLCLAASHSLLSWQRGHDASRMHAIDVIVEKLVDVAADRSEKSHQAPSLARLGLLACILCVGNGSQTGYITLNVRTPLGIELLQHCAFRLCFYC